MPMIGVRFSLLHTNQSRTAQYDPLAVDWAARVVANGGADPSAATKQAVSDFVAALRSANILSKMLAVCCLTPGSLVEALTPLIKTSGGAAYWTELVTNGAFTSDTNGWTKGGDMTGALACVSGGQSGNCLKVTSGGGQTYAYQSLATISGVRYKLTLYFKKGVGNGLVLVGTSAGDGSIYTSATYTDASWALKTIYFTATGATTYLSLATAAADAIDCYFDTVSCQVAVLCNDPWTNNNFVSGDLTVNGLVGNGSTKRLDTGYYPSNGNSLTTFGLTVYYFTTNNGDDSEIRAKIGTYPSASCAGLILYNNNSYFDSFSETNGSGRIVSSNAGFTGYVSGNRVSSSSTAIFKASSTVEHTTLVSRSGSGGSLPPIPLAAFACNNDGVYVEFSPKRLSFLAAHTGLTSGESASFYNAIQALRMALGGGYV